MEDFKALEFDDEVMKKIIRGSLEDHLMMPGSCLAACPSPNCEGVFRILQPGEDPSNQSPFYCVTCAGDICRRWAVWNVKLLV